MEKFSLCLKDHSPFYVRKANQLVLFGAILNSKMTILTHFMGTRQHT